jgi:membrane-associated phospholipid phosphatase
VDVIATALSIGGAAILVLSMAGARRDDIHPVEQRVFHAVNGLPDRLYWPLWLPMQLGNLVVGCVAGLAVAAWYRSWPMAAGVFAATGLKLVAERVLRSRMASFSVVRQRPGTSEPGAILRGDVPESGSSFQSGHIVLVDAEACIVAGAVPSAWSWVPFVLAVAVMVGRVYVGAHNPLDVTAGLGAGLVVGGLLLLVIR